jgi:glycogen phosphorylase
VEANVLDGISTHADSAQRESLLTLLEQSLRFHIGKSKGSATRNDVFRALSFALRPRLLEMIQRTEERYNAADAKKVCYLSAEFLVGQSLRNNLFNLGLLKEAEEATEAYGFTLAEIADAEPDASLGNGGLGRLAACYLESLATLGMPGYGYGINYEFGLFKQEIHNGYQEEKPDQWLKQESPWEIQRLEEASWIPLYGRIEHERGPMGDYNPMWVDWRVIVGVPYDFPIVGYGCGAVNTLRLFSARASDEFDMRVFNEGDYMRAVEQKIASETISKVLYPTDSFAAGRELRLIQEYFLVACALRDIFRRLRQDRQELDSLPGKVAIQMNDTHPSLAVAELMRLLIDENDMPWERAWEITQATCGYTNHTLMPEALEKWPVDLLEKVLPRHLQIIYEINHRFLGEISKRFPLDTNRLSRMSLIEESQPRQVRMAHLAIVGSHAVNGVAKLHSDLVKNNLVPDFNELWPNRFCNVTNGVTHRRWLASANPELARLLTNFAGEGWESDFSRILALENHAQDSGVQSEVQRIKRDNKRRLARLIKDETSAVVSLDSMFDVHVKRIHEYKRQLLNILRVIHVYSEIVDAGRLPAAPQTVIFAGKAAPGYHIAKQIIKLINNVAAVVNSDPRVKDFLKVVFLPNYRVTLAESIVPAADLSEQISTAGTEASGTSNMKFTMNGARTIGTRDGANIEIRADVGDANFYLFGLTAEQVMERRKNYSSRGLVESDPIIARAVHSLIDGRFTFDEPGIFNAIYDLLVHHGDHYLNLADFHSYVDAHARAESDYLDQQAWARKAILNIARSWRFTSDRAIQEYAASIWSIHSVIG